MNLIRRVRDATVDSTQSLADVLRTAKLLAAALKSNPLTAWVGSELQGYPDELELPSYRLVELPVLGTFYGPAGSCLRDQAIPMSSVRDHLKGLAGPAEFRQGVRELEAMASSADARDLRIGWPQEAVFLLRNHLEVSGGLVLADLYRPLSTAMLLGILDATRTKLLDFVLELAKLAGPDSEVSEPQLGSLPTDQVSDIFHITIVGDSNVVAAGERFTQSATVGNLENLKEVLRRLGIPAEDLAELEEAIESDCGRFSDSVKAWIGSMATKAAAGAWEATTVAATDHMIQAVRRYFGI